MATVVERQISETTLNRVVEYLNNEFGDDISNLAKSAELHEKLSMKKDEIETKLSIASDEVPSKLSQVLNEVDKVLKRLEELRVLQGQLDQQVSSHLARVGPIVNDLKQPIEEITYVEKYIRYLQWIQMVHDHSSEIQTALLVKAESRAVTYYRQLVDLHGLLSGSKCKHLVNFVNVTVSFWHQLLKDKFSSEFDELLKILKWPFVPPMTMDSLMRPDADVYARFQVLFTHLIQLHHPTESTETLVSNLQKSAMLLPLQLLLNPLQKRFKYHFCSKKETNKLEKPEWFFTQVLIWIRDHSTFLDQKIQPILDKADCNIDSRIEFMRGLVQLVVEKLNTNVEEILYDDVLLSHTIDEALQFDRELLALGYPMHYPNCISVLTEDPHFTRWINMERNSAVEKMDVIMSAATAWKSRLQDQGDVDDHHVPECGENFMTLILMITDRYKSLPLPGHRLQFLDLQLELLDDFRVRLQQLHKEDAKEPLDSNYCPILNTLNYIVHVLTDWSDLPFYVQMQYYKLQYEAVSQKLLLNQCASAPGSSPLDEIAKSFGDSIPLTVSSSSISLQKEALDSLQEDFENFKLEAMTGTVFDKVIELLEHKRDDMLRNLVGYSISEVKAKSKPYRSEKWFSMPQANEFVNLSVSPTACPMLMILKAELHMLKESLAVTLFDRMWQQMAEDLGHFLYHEVILRNHFNEGGAAQLSHDMLRNFFPIFGEFTRRPENYFGSVKEACALLILPKGSSLLLKDALSSDVPSSRDSLSENALLELGIYRLCRQEALTVLGLRTDLLIL